MIRRLAVAVLALTLAVLVPAAPAAAHNRLTSSVPAEGARLDAVPTEIVLEFAEALNPTYTQLIVTDAAKTRVAVSAPEVDGARARITVTGTPGDNVYTVAYRVVSKDGHPVQGSYAFTVGAGAPAAAPTTAAAAAPPATTGSAPTGPTALIAIAIAIAAVVVAGGAVAFWLSRRRRPAV
ncbi:MULTISPECIES: copper resistance CopC family protein [Catenuloplanes]|uniref:Methionine-rich copper-binding protein CopC n=1 Tax=Catenuloplanes niger TaxID=587534 RepID=A0AAE3ZKA0_9ACTN|nr:copper resistance protein CopC [Catenuloplanes niger]MDR7320256.1 methionine-rich copper-binding protein CopC [Catenuloplanes niger]